MSVESEMRLICDLCGKRSGLCLRIVVLSDDSEIKQDFSEQAMGWKEISVTHPDKHETTAHVCSEQCEKALLEKDGLPAEGYDFRVVEVDGL